MNCFEKNFKFVLAVLCVLLVTLNGCSKKETLSEKNFAGKWKSSRVSTPVFLHENGEWEIMTEEGGVLQQGVWQYKDNNIMWSFKIDNQMGHDTNAVLSVTPREFKLRESDRSITTFSKLD